MFLVGSDKMKWTELIFEQLTTMKMHLKSYQSYFVPKEQNINPSKSDGD